MQLVRFSNINEFLKITQSIYEAQESANNLILGISLRLRDEPQRFSTLPFLAVVTDDGNLLLSSVMTPPFPLILQGDEHALDAIDLLVTYCLEEGVSVPGVNGQKTISDAFARQWSSKTGQREHLAMALRAYELQQVTWPTIPAGKFREALKDDVSIVFEYFRAMQEETEPDLPHGMDLARILYLIDRGAVYLWEVDQNPVSMALSTRPTAQAITVSGVYTPPQERRKGYASACVAHLSQLLLDKGYRFVNLFTDLANPTSNAIYQEIGYKPVCDYHRHIFE
jgi:hypothetical protein